MAMNRRQGFEHHDSAWCRRLRSFVAGTIILVASLAPLVLLWNASRVARVTNVFAAASLRHAALHDDLQEADEALQLGEPVDTRDSTGCTPLHYAVNAEEPAILQLLLAHQADPNKRNNSGWSALDFAAASGLSRSVELLLESGAKVNQANADGATPLLRAVIRNDLATVKVLLDHGAQVNVRTTAGETPLLAAVRGESPELVSELLANGACAGDADGHGITPLMLARSLKLTAVLRVLEQHAIELTH